MSDKISVLYTTIDCHIKAENMAKQALEDGVATCINIFSGGCKSFYKWHGKVESALETSILFKTFLENKLTLVDWIKSNHPYDLPCILEFNPSIEPDFYQYINSSNHKN